MSPETGLILINATLAIFTLGLAYSAGKHISRIDHLEQWRSESMLDLKDWRTSNTKQIDSLFKELRAIHSLIITNDDDSDSGK